MLALTEGIHGLDCLGLSRIARRYIKKSGPMSASTNLLQANLKALSRKRRQQASKAFITYYSMPDWLDIFTFASDLKDAVCL